MPSPLAWVTPGLHQELAHLTLDEVCAHLANYSGNFTLDDVAAIAYINRLFSDENISTHAGAKSALLQCTAVTAQFAPLDESVLQLLDHITPSDELKKRISLLKRIAPPQDLRQRAQNHFSISNNAQGERLALQILKELPACIWAAVALLRGDYDEGRMPGGWLASFKCIPPLEPFWQQILFNHYAALGFREQAMEMWEKMDKNSLGSHTLNLAAEAMYAEGDRGAASSLYMRSLKKDPRLIPVRYRLEALSDPFVPDKQLLESRKINIYLYSWNKADFLEKTLRSLAGTNIGNARITVLLNGCTDDSLERVTAIRDTLFPGRLEIISLPVNVGAPAARNWLVALPGTREADYTAFLDDDVDVEENWLASLMTVLEAHPKAGVAGCKIVNPGTPRRYQYLYRTPSVVRDDLIRISLDTPPMKHDTGLYDFIRPTANVMGCCHVFRRQALLDCPTFDLRFSPSQMDDVAHDFDLALKGYEILYCGHVTCVHHQNTGKNFIQAQSMNQLGNILGNDVKFFHKFWDEREKLRQLMNK